MPGKDGQPTSESAYYLCANRNKRSIEIDLASAEGQALVLRLLANADVLIENYKVGGLAAYGLSYAQLKDKFPRLIYCSITGFGQTGPYAGRAGYDFLIQGMGGIMSLTGAPDGEPMRIGVAWPTSWPACMPASASSLRYGIGIRQAKASTLIFHFSIHRLRY